MERQRRSFTEEYKRQAVELVVSSRRSITSVAKELEGWNRLVYYTPYLVTGACYGSL
jgi:transposase-like protein